MLAFGEPDAEREGGLRFECSGEALQHAHIVGIETLGLQQRSGRKSSGAVGRVALRRRQPDAIGVVADGQRGIDPVDGVDAVAAAALGVVEHVVEDRQAAEVGVFADLVLLVAELRDVEAGHRRREAGTLRDFRLVTPE